MIDFMWLKTYLKKKYIKIKIYKNVLTNENLKSHDGWKVRRIKWRT